MIADRPVSFLMLFKKESPDEDLSCNFVNSITNEKLTVELYLNAWLIGRLPQSCTELPHEMGNRIIAYHRNLPNVKIDLLGFLNLGLTHCYYFT